MAFSVIAIPAIADEIEWVDAQEETLRLTESVSRAGYIVEASDFYDTTALISVYSAKSGIITRNVTRAGDSIEINDELNITIIDLEEKRGNIGANRGINVILDEWVTLQTRIAGKPAPKVSVIPFQLSQNNRTVLNRVFRSNSEIWINFSIKNDGKAILKELTLEVNSTLPLLSGEKLNFDLYQIEAGNSSDVIRVRFIAPVVKDRKIFTVSATVEGKDIFGRTYRAFDSTDIEVVPVVERTAKIGFKKYVSEKVFLGDLAVVSLILENSGSEKVNNVNLTESLPPGLEPFGTDLKWNFSLEPFEKKSISYRVKPEKPGTYIFAPGSSDIEYYGGLVYGSKIPKLIVTGPYVVLTKSANTLVAVKGENVTITVEARNIGDSTAIVKLGDHIPFNDSLSEKELRYLVDTMVIRPGQTSKFSYTLKAENIGNYSLPQVRAKITDQFLYEDDRYTQRITSNKIAIEVREFKKFQQRKINLTKTSLKAVSLEPQRERATDPVGTEIPEITASPSKTVPGFQVYLLFIVFLMITHFFKVKKFKNEIRTGENS